MEEQHTNNQAQEPADNTEPTPQAATTLTVEEVAKLQQEREEYLNGWRRAAADFANYKKEEDQRAATVRRVAKETVLNDLLPVLDSLDRAIEAHGEATSGLDQVKEQFLAILRKLGIELLQVNHGDVFDPSLHEAIGETPTENKEHIGAIVEVMSSGYQIGGKLIRPAKVLLGSAKKEVEN